jgi:hypothetical protein
MTQENERLEILEMIQRGTISAEEGLKLIESLGETWDDLDQEYAQAKARFEGTPESELTGEADSRLDPEGLKEWRKWWIIPFWIGVVITVGGGGLMYWAWSAKGIGVGFVLSWIPFLIGIGILVLGWNSRTGPWLHLRIQQKPGEKPERITISLPMPIRFVAWGLRTFGSFIPNLGASGLDEIILALGESSQAESPLIIDVDDEDEGEKVKIYIG